MNSNVDTVDATMEAVREQMELTNEISEAISNPVGMGVDVCFAPPPLSRSIVIVY